MILLFRFYSSLSFSTVYVYMHKLHHSR